jgi:hypothetical protein
MEHLVERDHHLEELGVDGKIKWMPDKQVVN